MDTEQRNNSKRHKKQNKKQNKKQSRRQTKKKSNKRSTKHKSQTKHKSLTKHKSQTKHKKSQKRNKILLQNKKGGFMPKCACIDYEVVGADNYSLLNNKNHSQCNHNAESGSDFCSKHQKCPSFLKSFVSNYEVDYDPKKWQPPYIEGSHNCYTYFLNNQIKAVQERCHELCQKKHGNDCPKKVSQCSNLKPQPGDYYYLLSKGNLDKGANKYSCPLMESRILGDNENIKRVRFDQKCPKYHYKGAMVVDPGHTYHFYRQNNDGTWSHKPGTLPVTAKDASEKTIYVPHLADRNYNKEKKKDGINYVDFCGYYCVPNNKYLNTHAI